MLANRDELYARPSEGPRLLSAAPRVWGGRDVEKGGTWLGVNEGGFFVGLTNQRPAVLPDPARRSRGEVVVEALRRPDLAAALGWLGALDARGYNGFNLLIGDGEALWVGYARPEAAAMQLTELPAGIWSLSNDVIGSPAFPKTDRAAKLAETLVGLPFDELVPRARALLADHALPEDDPLAGARPPFFSPDEARQLGALCVHTRQYGTVSASLLALGGGRIAHYLHAAGPPCTTPLAPVYLKSLGGSERI